MARSAPIQRGFNGGIFGSRLQARTDLDRYSMACRTMKNFIPTVQGPAVKRSGTRYVKSAKSNLAKSRLVPFEFSRDQAYVLEFYVNGVRFLRDSGAVLETSVAISGGTPPTAANPCVVTTSASHGYSTGDEVYIAGSQRTMINNQFFTITVLSATTFSIPADTTGEGTVAASGNTVSRVYAISDGVSGNSIPWSTSELNALQFAQDGDVMYVFHPDHAPHKIVRTSDTSWTCSEVVFAWPPFRDENISDVTFYASAATGTTVTVTASAATFTADMVGGYVKLGEVIEGNHVKWIDNSNMAAYFDGGGIALNDQVYYEDRVYELTQKNGGATTGQIPPVHDEGAEYDTLKSSNNFEFTFINRGWGYGKITGFTSATVVTVDVDTYGVTFPNSVVGSGNATKKWAIGAFCDEYGYPASGVFYEQRLWMGGTNRDPQTFWGSRTNRYEDFEKISDDADSGLQWTIASGKINQIVSMVAADALVIVTRGGEFTVQSNSTDEAITPDNVKVTQRSAFGSAGGVTPIFVDSALILVHRDSRRLYELVYDFNTDRYAGVDLTSFSHDILNEGATSISYQASPFRQVLVNTSTGIVKSLTYVRDDEVLGWSTIELGAALNQSVIESVCVIPHPDGGSDQVWFEVLRDNGNGFVRWIEFLEVQFIEGDLPEDSYFVDGGSTYTGAVTTTVSGLLHLAGLTVTYQTGGSVSTGSVSSKGKLTVPPTVKCHIGFPVSASLETMDFETGQPPGYSTLGDRGRVVSAVFRLHNTGSGFQFSNDIESSTFDTFTSSESLFTGDTPLLTVPGGFERTRHVAIKHETALPCTLLAIMPKLDVEAG